MVFLARLFVSTDLASLPNVSGRRCHVLFWGKDHIRTQAKRVPPNKPCSAPNMPQQEWKCQVNYILRRTHSEREVCTSQPTRNIMLTASIKSRSFSVCPHPKSCPQLMSTSRIWVPGWGLDSLERKWSGRTWKWLSSQTQSLFDE